MRASNLLIRIHGGARSLEKSLPREFTNEEKLFKNKEEKVDIAKKIAAIIESNKNVFLGAGTTIEYVDMFLSGKNYNIYTNSLYLFRKLLSLDGVDIKLIGGEFREVTGAFVGTLSLDTIKTIRFNQAFIGVNGLNDGKAFTYSPDEGILQQLILNNSKERYLIGDSSKVGIEDFYHFYDLDQAKIITDSDISEEKLEELKQYTQVIK